VDSELSYSANYVEILLSEEDSRWWVKLAAKIAGFFGL
jgi:hypothetical protein